MKLLPLLALALVSLVTRAAAEGDAPTHLADRGAVLLDEPLKNFNTKTWQIYKGDWAMREGIFTGKELETEKVSATVRHAQAFKNAIIQFEVRLDGAKYLALTFIDGKERLARIGVSPVAFSAQREDRDKDGPDKAQIFGRRAVSIKPGEWHTVLIEIVGDTLVATVDNAQPIAGSHELLANDKTGFTFTVGGDWAGVRNVTVWEATPKKDADQIRQELISKSAAPRGKGPK